MIHHLSVAARDPKRVADFLAALMGGVAVDFPPNPGSFMAFAPDGQGTAVEVYPAGSVMREAGEAGAAFARRPEFGGESATHFALSVEGSPEDVRRAAAEHGWACHTCDRGGHFHVMEVWIENSWLVEILPPAFAAEYLGFANQIAEGADAEALLATHPAHLADAEPLAA